MSPRNPARGEGGEPPLPPEEEAELVASLRRSFDRLDVTGASEVDYARLWAEGRARRRRRGVAIGTTTLLATAAVTVPFLFLVGGGTSHPRPRPGAASEPPTAVASPAPPSAPEQLEALVRRFLPSLSLAGLSGAAPGSAAPSPAVTARLVGLINGPSTTPARAPGISVTVQEVGASLPPSALTPGDQGALESLDNHVGGGEWHLQVLAPSTFDARVLTAHGDLAAVFVNDPYESPGGMTKETMIAILDALATSQL